jgi:hypothetical protein
MKVVFGQIIVNDIHVEYLQIIGQNVHIYAILFKVFIFELG